MPRYTGWRRLSGDTADRPDLLDLGKRLLGELETQRRLSGIKTCSMQRRTADGSIVTARFIGDIPSVDVQAASRVGGGFQLAALFGLVTKPRKFGTNPVASDGMIVADPGTSQNAYGQNAHALLVPLPDAVDPTLTDWRSAFFDSTFLPAAGGGQYGSFFRSGLSAHGDVDWRDAQEEVAITWVGAASRIWLASVESFGTHFDRIQSTRVFHNGREILNHPVLYAGVAETIVGACLRRQGGRALLVYATRNSYASTGSYAIRIYTVPLRPDAATFPWLAKAPPTFNPLHAPLFKVADPAEIVQIGELVLPTFGDGASGYGLATLFFNQSGTQARGIVVTNNKATEDLGFIEVVADLNVDLTEATFATIDHGAFHRHFVRTTTYVDVEPDVYMYMGVEEQIYTGGSAVANKVNERTIVSQNLPSASGPFPIAVDFQDNVPVYLWYTPESATSTTTYTSDWSSTETGWWGDGSGVIDASQVEVETISVSVTGGRVHAVDSAGVTWFDVSTDRESLEQFNSSDTLNLAATGMSRTHGSERVRDDRLDPGHFEDRYPVLWWGDLRSRSMAYSMVTLTTFDATTTSGTASGGPTPDGIGYADPDSVFSSVRIQENEVYGVDTRVLFYGAQVRAMTSNRTVVDTDTTTESTPPPSTILPRHVLTSGYGTDETTGAVVVLEQDQMLEDALQVQQLNADLNFLGVGTSPLIAYEPTSELDPAYPRYDTRWGAWIAYRGTWAYSMHDLDREDPRPLAYTHGIKDGDLTVLAGDRADVELFETMWPLSLSALPLGPT